MKHKIEPEIRPDNLASVNPTDVAPDRRYVRLNETPGTIRVFSRIDKRHLSLYPGGVFAAQDETGAWTVTAEWDAAIDMAEPMFVHMPSEPENIVANMVATGTARRA